MHKISDYKTLSEQAIEAFGPENQIQMYFEESAELTDAICKFRRGRVGNEAVTEEIADVIIMCDQLKHIFGTDSVDRWVAIKRARLYDRIQVRTKPNKS